MANPTTNYGWVMPTSTDLVTDLPADFNVFGQAVDTSLVDLLGGTTGQVLAKASNANMDFVWSADAAGMTNPMTTTGDTIYSSSGSTPARRGIGSTGQVLTVSGGIPTWATPGSSFVGCSLFKSADQTISNATQTIITFDSEEFDTDGFHSTVTNTGRITIPAGKDGKYLIVAGVTQQWGAGDKKVLLDLNGAALGSLTTLPSPTVSYDWANTVSRVLSLVATDYVEVKAYQDSGGSKAVRGTAGSLQYLTYFQAIYLGA